MRKAPGDPKGPLRRLLIEVYRREGQLDRAEAIAAEMASADPKDPAPAATQARLAVARALVPGEPDARALAEKAARLIQGLRKAFPDDPTFAELECDLAARRGDLPRALAITREMEAKDKSSAGRADPACPAV